MEQEGLALPEGIDSAMEETHEESRVETHGSRSVQQDDEPQRLLLAMSPGEIDRRTAMGDAAVDRAAKIEPPPTPACPLAPHQARAHGMGEACGQLVGFRDF